MDIPQLTSPPSIHVLEHNSTHDRHYPSSRSHYASTPMPSSREGMPIPNRRPDEAPPPLPPPKFSDDIANGQDLGWKWGNSQPDSGPSRPALAPIKPGSSLFGGYQSGSLGQSTRSTWGKRQHEIDTDGHRDSAGLALRSPSEPEIKVEELRSSFPSIGSTPSSAEVNNRRSVSITSEHAPWRSEWPQSFTNSTYQSIMWP